MSLGFSKQAPTCTTSQSGLEFLGCRSSSLERSSGELQKRSSSRCCFGRERHSMAEIVGAIATSHIPAIGRAIAQNLQEKESWKPFFDGFKPVHAWLDRV